MRVHVQGTLRWCSRSLLLLFIVVIVTQLATTASYSDWLNPGSPPESLSSSCHKSLVRAYSPYFLHPPLQLMTSQCVELFDQIWRIKKVNAEGTPASSSPTGFYLCWQHHYHVWVYSGCDGTTGFNWLVFMDQDSLAVSFTLKRRW